VNPLCGFPRHRSTTIRFSSFVTYWRKKMGVQWNNTSAIHRLQESLWFSYKGSIVQYSHRVLGTHEISKTY
jgi:hypothetical protein